MPGLSRRVRLIGLIVAVSLSVGPSHAASTTPGYQSQDPLQRAREILKRASLIDGHNDFPYQLMLNFDGQLKNVDMHDDLRTVFHYQPDVHPSQTDIPRLRQGVVGAQLWSAFAPCFTQFKDAVKKGMESVDVIKRFTAKFNDTFDFVTDADGMLDSHTRGKIASMIGLEGGHMIDNSMAVLRLYYELGVRYMTLTHACDTPWADGVPNNASVYMPKHFGLSQWGKRVVKEMNRVGMMVDLSHVTFDTMNDALDVTEAPVIFSHSQAYDICPHPRNVPDAILRRMKKNNGLVMVNFYPPLINCTEDNRHLLDGRTASLGQLADHIEHIRYQTGSSDHVGLGAAYDAIDYAVDDVEDVSRYPYLFAELIRRGWSDEDLEKLAFKNFYRVFKAVEQVRDSKRHEQPDDTIIDMADIDQDDRTCMTFSWDGSEEAGTNMTSPQTPTTAPTPTYDFGSIYSKAVRQLLQYLMRRNRYRRY